MTVRGTQTTLAVSTVSGAICTDKEDEMVKALVTIAILVGLFAVAAVACGGGDDEEAPPPPAAAAAQGPPEAPSASPDPGLAAATATAVAIAAGDVRSGPTGTDPETGAILYSLYVVGGGGGTGEKTNLYGNAPFNWEVNELTFNVGDTVTITAIPTEDKAWVHTFTIQDLGVLSKMKFGNPTTVTITFDKPGTFKFRCDLHKGEGMNGTITVQ